MVVLWKGGSNDIPSADSGFRTYHHAIMPQRVSSVDLPFTTITTITLVSYLQCYKFQFNFLFVEIVWCNLLRLLFMSTQTTLWLRVSFHRGQVRVGIYRGLEV